MRIGPRIIGIYLSVATVAGVSGITSAVAQEKSSDSENVGQIIVTGTRLENTTETTGSSVSVLSEQDLEDGIYRNATEAIQQVPGVDVVQSGGQGGNAGVFLRGGNSEFTLVMLDGIELNNPASTNRSFNISNLTLENIERIEVVRGPQSTIYGSDAMGGVINLVSKKAQEGVHTSLSSQAGSYNSFTQVGNVSYGSKQFDVSTGITQQNVGGISAASAGDGNTEHDGYDNTSLSNRMRLAPTEDLELTSTTRYTNSRTDFDNYGGIGGDDPNRDIRNDEFFTRGDISAKFLERTLTPAAYIAYTRHHLADNNSPDAVSSDLLDSSFGGNILTVGSRATWEPTKYLSSVLGWETQGERADSQYHSVSAYGPYDSNMDGVGQRTDSIYYETQGSYEKRYTLEAGVRRDNVSTFGGATTFKVAPSVRFDSGTKLRSSVGTGFKAPSLVELYSSYGNPDLKAQRSVGWDVGVDQDIIKDRLSGSLTYFHNYYDDLITFNPSTFVLENVDRSHTQGVEVASNVELSEQLSARLAYTYTEAENDSTQQALLRRPKNKNSLTVVYQPTNRIRAQVQWRLYSSRFDNDFNTEPPSRVTLGGYGIVDLAISYKLRESVELFAKVDNLFDKEYQEVYGYGTLGAAGYGGIKLSL